MCVEKDISPLVSIIIPIFNGKNNISQIVDNVNSQTYAKKEIIIVVDSRSTDGSYDLIKKALDKLPIKSKMVLQTGTGKLGEARNIGMECAQGEIIWFLDADDLPLPTLLSETVSIMKADGSDIIFFNHYSVMPNDDSDLPEIDEGKVVTSHLTRKEGLEWRLYNKLPIPSWSMIFRKKLVSDNKLAFLTTNVAEDEDFAFRLLSKSNKISYYNKPLYVYAYNPNAWWRERYEIRDYIKMYLDLSDYFLAEDPEFERVFTPSILRACMHTSTRSRKNIYRTVLEDRYFRDLVKLHLPRNMEAFIFLHFPNLYYHIVRRIVDDKDTPPVFDGSCLK